MEPSKIPVDKIITNIEYVIRQSGAETEKKDEVRHLIATHKTNYQSKSQ